MAVLFFYLSKTGGCAGGLRAENYHGETMGTAYNVTVVYPRGTAIPSGLSDAVQQALGAVDQDLSTYKDDSSLSKLNQHADSEAFAVSQNTAVVLRAAQQVSRATDGAFDVTVGPLVNAWGFGPENTVEAPDDETLDRLLEDVGYQLVAISKTEDRVTKARPGVYCDLSAIAKGYGVDEAAEALDVAGVANYMVEVGGEVRCRGINVRGGPWRIAIERPSGGIERVFQRIVALENIALATSGDYRNYFVDDAGGRRSHTIDPRTGHPVDHNLASVSVLHESCMMADAWATALMVLGPEEGMARAEEFDLPALFLVRESDDTFTEHPSTPFRPYLSD